MTGRSVASFLAAAIGSGALLIPAPASADRDHYVVSAGSVVRVHLHGSHDYRVGVTENSRGFAVLHASKGGAKTQYATRGQDADGDGIDAKLPGFGRVRVEFAPRGRSSYLGAFRACDAGPTRQEGVVRGRIRFRGEHDYTEVDVRRAEAEVLSWPRLRCRYVGGPGRGPRIVGSLSAYAVRARLEFGADKYVAGVRPASKRVKFTATAADFRKRLRIFRSVSVTAGVESFGVPDATSAPENVVLTPPGQFFSGSANYQRTPESTFAWEGDLKVSFPGMAAIALTGPDFETRYCALAGCIYQFGDDLRRQRTPVRRR